MTAPPVPRRWTHELGGIRWLPRLIDKARMAQRGELGTYLLRHSPVDIGLLHRLRITTQQFASIVAASADDGAVLAELRSRGYDEARLSRWSANLPRRHPWILGLIDRDEGYVSQGPWLLAILAFRATDGFWMGLVRRVMKAP